MTMLEDDELETAEESVQSAQVPHDDSPLERLRALHLARRPGFFYISLPELADARLEFALQMKRIRYVGGASKIFRTMRDPTLKPAAEINAELDLLIEGLDQIVCRPTDGEGEDGKWQPIDPVRTLGFGQDTAELLGLNANSQRDVCRELFGGKINEFIIKRAAGQYFEWLQEGEKVSRDEGNA